MRTFSLPIKIVFFFLLVFPAAAPAVNGRVVEQDRGIQVLEVWGTNSEMGRALARFQAGSIGEMISFMRGFSRWSEILQLTETCAWDGDQLEVIQAMAEALPGIGAAELKALNVYGDWSYNHCRAYSVWGELAEGGGSVGGRRLMKDDIPRELADKHAIICFQPNDRPAWANFGAPGYVCSVTGLNEFGCMFALHDHCSSGPDTAAALMSRCGACALVSRATDADEAEYILRANPGGTGSYIFFWGGAGENEGGAVFCYGKAGRLHGGPGRLHRRNPCPQVLGGMGLTCGNDRYPVSHSDCGIGGHAAELVAALGLPGYSLARAEEPLSPGSQHTVYAESRARREIEFYMWARVAGGQVRGANLRWEDCFRHSPPVPRRLAVRLGPASGPQSLSIAGDRLEKGREIRLNLPEDGYANLGVFSSRGALVRTLVNRRLAGGAYALEWDGLDNSGAVLEPGEYELRLRSVRGIFSRTCRLVAGP